MARYYQETPRNRPQRGARRTRPHERVYTRSFPLTGIILLGFLVAFITAILFIAN